MRCDYLAYSLDYSLDSCSHRNIVYTSALPKGQRRQSVGDGYSAAADDDDVDVNVELLTVLKLPD